MFDIAWEELALIIGVALIVIGPKELPNVLRTLGQWTRRIRSMTGEFQKTIENAVREAELSDVREEVRQLTQTDLRKVIEKEIDPDGHLQQALSSPDVLMTPLSSSTQSAHTIGSELPLVPFPTDTAVSLPQNSNSDSEIKEVKS